MSVVANTIGEHSFHAKQLADLTSGHFLGNRAYFFGGVQDEEEDEENISGTFFNDLYCLDLEKLNFNRSIFTLENISKEIIYRGSFSSYP